MRRFGSEKFRTIRVSLLTAAVFVLLVSTLLQSASAQTPQQPLAQAATSTNGYWKFDNVTPFDKFTSSGPGSSWSPSYKDSSNGGTVINATDSGPADSVTTECAWSFTADPKVLRPGQTVEVTLTVNTIASGLSKNITMSGQDSMTFIDFTGNSNSTQDDYGVNGTTSVTAQATGSASFVVQPGWTGAAKPATRRMQFQCNVASLAIISTAWNYVWVEGPLADITATPTETGALPFTPSPGAGVKLANLLLAAGVAIAVIGAILAAVGLLVLVIKGVNKGGKPTPKPTGPTPPQPDPPKIRYALRVSANSVEVYPGQPASVTFSAWRILPEGGGVPAIEAEIRVRVPESPAGLVAAPDSGMCSLVSTFSVPNPQVCATLYVSATALVGGKVMAQANVQVCILPVYSLELKWEDPGQPALQVEGMEARAWAKVTATPPDPDTAPDVLAGKINVSLQGPNSDWIRQPLNPLVEYEKQWNALAAIRPGGTGEMQPGNPSLVAEFSSGGQHLFARLAVPLEQSVELGAWVNGKDQADAALVAAEGGVRWEFTEIVSYFHAKGATDKPIAPAVRIEYDTPPIQAKPDILDIKDFSAHPDNTCTIQVELKPGTDLETYFKDTPPDQRLIQVTVSARGQDGQPYTAHVSYRIRASVVFCVHSYDSDPNIPGGHTYRELELQEMELVANADDCLNLAGYLMRKQDFLENGPSPELRLSEELASLDGFSWPEQADSADLELPQPDPGGFQDGFFLFNLKSRTRLAATPERLSAMHNLRCKLSARVDVPAACTLDASEFLFGIRLQLLKLHLWVVPGARRHTSAAAAYLEVLPAHLPLGEQQLFIATQAPAGMSLELAGDPASQTTLPRNTSHPNGPGTAFWLLRYAGLTWANMPQAEFNVRCGLEDPPDAIWQADTTINVDANLRGLLNALTDAANLGSGQALSTQVNNPTRINYDQALARDPLGQSAAVPEVLRDCLAGPIWNMTHVLNSNPPYVCKAMRDAIIEWLLRRRFYGSGEPVQAAVGRMQSMNGIDFGHYAIVPAHVWAGLFPAGALRFDEYRALDPWWAQQWNPAWRDPGQLLTQADEEQRGAAFVQVNRLLAAQLVIVTPTLNISGALKAIQAWLNGAPPREAARLLGGDVQEWWHSLRVDSDCVQAGTPEIYSYAGSEGAWLKPLIKGLG